MKKNIVILLSLVVLAGVLASCVKAFIYFNKREADAGKTESNNSIPIQNNVSNDDLTELTFILADGDLTVKELYTEYVKVFNQTHPEIRVTIEQGNGGTYSEFLRTKYNTGEFPDIMEMKDVREYVLAKALSPLPKDIVALFKSTVKINQMTYVAPENDIITDGIIYNKRYFEENELKEPNSFEEFLKLCQTIKDKNDMTPLVVAGQEIWPISFWFNKVYNDQVVASDPDFIAHCHEGSKNFRDPAFQALLEEMKQIFQYVQEDWEQTLDSQVTSYLVNGQAAMLYSGTHMFAQIKKADSNFEIGWMSIPSPDGKYRIMGGPVTNGLSISAETAKDPVRKEAAEEFIRYFFTSDFYMTFCETLYVFPSTKDDSGIELDRLFQKVKDNLDNADIILNYWDKELGEKELPAGFRTELLKNVIEVLQNKKDINQACDDLNYIWKARTEIIK